MCVGEGLLVLVFQMKIISPNSRAEPQGSGSIFVPDFRIMPTRSVLTCWQFMSYRGFVACAHQTAGANQEEADAAWAQMLEDPNIQKQININNQIEILIKIETIECES